MISLSALVALADEYRSEMDLPVGPLRVGERVFDLDTRPVVMGCVNLSRDSTYRESVATSTVSAIRKGRVLRAQGADLVDIGAESSTARAARVDSAVQIARLVPVIEELAAEGGLVSVETYQPEVARAGLAAGARLVNFTGGVGSESEIFDQVAEFGATIVLCHVAGADVREITDVTVDADPVPALLDHFAARVDRARARGVDRIIIDPGLGFYYGNLVDPLTRARHQARVILNTFRLRRLGLPVCHAMPHAFDLFEAEYRSAEGFFAVLAQLGGTSVFRTHEVPNVVAVLNALQTLDAE